MFSDIPEVILDRMEYLAAMDRGEIPAPPPGRLWQVPPETGKFLALTAAAAPSGTCIEIGASGGYSGLWLSLAMRVRGSRLYTFEMDEGRAALAEETYRAACVDDVVILVRGDARARIPEYSDVAFAFLDCDKQDYSDMYDVLIPGMIQGGILVADNLISHRKELGHFLESVEADERVDAMVVPVGNGLLFLRKIR